MPEGKSQSVEAEASEGPTQKTLWARLKPLWHMRGIIAAFSLVGIADQMGLVRQDWLRLVHALGARWNAMMQVVADFFSWHLPVSLTVGEANAITALSLLVVPTMVSSVIQFRRKGGSDFGMVVCYAALLLFLVALPLTPIDLTARRLAFLVWVFGHLSVLMAVLALRPTGLKMTSAERLLVLILAVASVGLPWFVAFMGPSSDDLLEPTLIVVTSAPIFLVLIGLLYAYARPFLGWLLASVAFMLTLEAIYLAPIVQDWAKPIVEAIDPDPLHRQPSPLSAPEGEQWTSHA